MFLIVWCLTLLPGIFGDPTEVFRGKHRIVNGTAAPPGSFPYMISLQFDGVHFCGGTILNDKWILTAAHCVDGMIANSLSVVAGTVDLKSGGVTVGVISYVPHESYDPVNNYENDIAVVELESALPLGTNPSIAKVKLPKQGQVTEANKMATVIGWGFLYTGGPASEKLMMVNVRTYSDEECSRLLAGNNHPATDMCAGIPEGLHCGGDSGGPLIVEGLQVGIVSWSVEPCALPPYPGVYTEVSQFKKWIKNTTSNSY